MHRQRINNLHPSVTHRVSGTSHMVHHINLLSMVAGKSIAFSLKTIAFQISQVIHFNKASRQLSKTNIQNHKMSAITKSEKNLATNVANSKSPLSIKSIIKDLQNLDKSLITKHELDTIKNKMKKLEDENSRIKNELQATEADRKLYYNQFHQNVKELSEMKAENESLKAEISLLKNSNDKRAEKSNIGEIANSSFQSAIPVNDSESENGDDNQEILPALAIEGGSDAIEPEPSVLNQTDSLSSMPTCNGEPTQPNSKKAKLDLFEQWSCTYKPCTQTLFTTIEHLRSHINDVHPERKFTCGRCPYATKDRSKVMEHERSHRENDLKLNGVEGAKRCTLCNVFFKHSGLTLHNKMYHC